MKKIFSLILVFCMATLGLSFFNFNNTYNSASAQTPAGEAISSAEDFSKITTGSYYLASDIKLTSDYKPINFSGVLDGNGYSISLEQTQGQDLEIGQNSNILTSSDGVITNSVHVFREISSLKYKYEISGETVIDSNSYTFNRDSILGDIQLSNTISSLFTGISYNDVVSNFQNISLIVEEIKTVESGSQNIDDYYGVSDYSDISLIIQDDNTANFTVPTLNHGYVGGITLNVSFGNESFNFVLKNLNETNRIVTISKEGNILKIEYENTENTPEIIDYTINNDMVTFINLSDIINSGLIKFGLGSLNYVFVENLNNMLCIPTDYSKKFVNNTDKAITLNLIMEAQVNGVVEDGNSTSEFTITLAPGEHDISFYIGGDPNRTNGYFSDNVNVMNNPENYTFVIKNLTQLELNVKNVNSSPLRYSFVVEGTAGGENKITSSEIIGYISAGEEELISYTFYSLFGNIQSSNYSFNITNIKNSIISENGGLFNRLTNATIKNLKIEDWTTFTSSSSVGLLAHTAEGSIIDSVEVSGYIEVNANTSIIAGGIVGTSTGTKISNSYSTAQIKATGTSLTASQIVVGGLVGKQVEGEISNSFVFCTNSNLEKMLWAEVVKNDLTTDSMPITDVIVGGLVGVVWEGKIVNNFATGEIYGVTVNDDVAPKVGLLFGEMGTGVYLPVAGNIAYNHTASSSSYDLIGAETTYILTSCTKVSNVSIFREQSTFVSSSMWDTIFYPWNFSEKWYAKAGEEHIVLQPFESFTISLSYSTHVKQSPQIIADSFQEGENLVKFGDTVTIKAEVAEGEELLYAISNIQKDGQSLELIKDETGVSVTFIMNASTSGLYTIITEPISYNLVVESQDLAQGGVRIRGAQKELDKIEINVSSGGLYEFEAVPAKNYGFVEWVWVTEVDGQEVLTTAKLGQTAVGNEDTRLPARQSVAIRFSSENLGNTYLYVPMPTEINQVYTLRAIFTSQICNMTVRTSLSTENCATIYINEVPYEYSSENNYVFSGSISRDADVIIRIEVKDGYEFKGWQAGNTSDPIESFLKNSSASDEEITFRTSNQQFLLIANIEKSEDAGSNLNWLWWTLGGIGGAGILGVAIWLIIRKSRSAGFMSDYY